MSLVQRLAKLVAFDTQNPSGDERPLCEELAADLRRLGARNVEALSTGAHHGVFACFGEGTPRVLLNAHVDTVPATHGPDGHPFELADRGGRLYGLGAADTKGAIAAILEAIAQRNTATGQPRGFGVLLSGDEEREGSVVRAFLAGGRARGFERAIVCEPTGLAVGTRHRGISSIEVEATSPGGHSSLADALPAPVVALARAAVALDALARRLRAAGPPGFPGICLNLAAIEGSAAFNTVPPSARLVGSLRPAPGADVAALLGDLERAARDAAAPDAVTWRVPHANPPFSTRDVAAFSPLLGDRARDPVDLGFWTEAALYAEAGIDAVVFGPGHVEQAHSPGEFVALDELEAARDTFARILA